MSKHKLSITQIANEAGIEIDEALIRLWDEKFDDINYPSDVLSGSRLNQAKRVLGLATKKELVSISYWISRLGLSKEQFLELIKSWGFSVSSNSKTLPPGLLKKLNAYASTVAQNSVQQYVQEEMRIEETIHVVIEQKFIWRIVGKEKHIRCLNIDEVLAIHYALCKDFLNHSDPIEPQGTRDRNLIESAIFRQHTSVGETRKYPTVEMTAAALLHSLVLNHPFYNGNKRTALVSMLVLLDENGLMLTTNEDYLFKFILQVAQHRIIPYRSHQIIDSDAEVIAIAEWIRANSRVIEMGERPLPYRKLKQILTHHGCEFTHSSTGTNVKITRKIKPSFWSRFKILTANISYGNEGRDISRKTINKVRSDLNLDEDNGIDSAAFYEDVPLMIDNFIIKYRKTLQRLSKV